MTYQDPREHFLAWFGEAEALIGGEASSMALATADKDGRPSVRIVYFRGLLHGCFTFYTNYESRKGGELAENPWAAILFHWRGQWRQVRVEGTVTKMGHADSDRYFQKRSRESRIGAWASPQSKTLSSRKELLQLYEEKDVEFGDGPIPLPSFWGGYLLEPERMEFWTSGEHRLHHRLLYSKENGNWSTNLQAP